LKKTTIITAKILDYYAELIDRGVKHYEVRSSSLDGADAICLVSADSGETLGIYAVIKVLSFGREEDEKVMALAQTTPEQFYGLFPKPDVGGPERLWAAELGERTSLDTLVALEASK
jgi:hypothetical protein